MKPASELETLNHKLGTQFATTDNPPVFFHKSLKHMKRILFAAFAAIAFASCQTSKTASPFGVHSELMATNAANIQTPKGYIAAGYDNGAAVVYAKGGASVLLNGRQHELEGSTTTVEGGAWLCTSLTGDFIKIFPYTGVTTGKIVGQTFAFMPDENGTKVATEKPE